MCVCSMDPDILYFKSQKNLNRPAALPHQSTQRSLRSQNRKKQPPDVHNTIQDHTGPNTEEYPTRMISKEARKEENHTKEQQG